ncbi:hypothetical protein FEM48_ZijujUnG0086400 [Ziziphus jujuba var. spinosa]|uniref:Arginine and glutamate-rich protein 1 n=1 Tax=Ziziphus jujuba var. spinosa TaxID=714518 RepID=A0A978U8L2_ZIZJJ|nr:hypothetical protein FEM48_ZijujUnG0086400 [Ziziphus jujuba var. spinosa]
MRLLRNKGRESQKISGNGNIEYRNDLVWGGGGEGRLKRDIRSILFLRSSSPKTLFSILRRVRREILKLRKFRIFRISEVEIEMPRDLSRSRSWSRSPSYRRRRSPSPVGHRRKSPSLSPRWRKSRSPTLRRRRSRSPTPRRHKKQGSTSSSSLGSIERKISSEVLKKEEEEKKRCSQFKLKMNEVICFSYGYAQRRLLLSLNSYSCTILLLEYWALIGYLVGLGFSWDAPLLGLVWLVLISQMMAFLKEDTAIVQLVLYDDQNGIRLEVCLKSISILFSAFAFMKVTFLLNIFSCLFRRQQEAELKLVEEETAKRVEEAISRKVEESLNSEEIKVEIQRRLEEGRKKLLDEVAAQLEKEKEAALIEARHKEEQVRREKEELERLLEENRRRVEEAQRREALEQQRREEERYRELEELQRQKEEAMRRKKQEEEQEQKNQMKLLGKNKSRPKLSFAIGSK